MITDSEADLLDFVLRHGQLVADLLRTFEDLPGAQVAANDLQWLVKVNRPNWTHADHTGDCMSDWAEKLRSGMTDSTIAANHCVHIAEAERIEAAFRRRRF